MNLDTEKATVVGVVVGSCLLCGTEIRSGELCASCKEVTRRSVRFAELFWDEA